MGIPLSMFSHYTFNAGENKGEAPTFFSKSELDRVLNVEIKNKGIVTRSGSLILNNDIGTGFPSPIAGNPKIRSMFDFSYGVATVQQIYNAGTSIYVSGSSPVEIKTGLTNDLTFQGVKCEDVFYLTNGTDAVQYYDPARSAAQTYTVGYADPGAFTATAQAIVGSTLVGTYGYYVTLFDENTQTESNAQAASVSCVVGGANNSVKLTNLPTDPEDRSTHHIIYRLDPTTLDHYRLDKIAYVAAGSYDDIIPTTGNLYIAPDDNDRPDPSPVMCKHGKVMVYCYDSVVTWSKSYRYQNVPTYNREHLDDNSRKIVAAYSFRDALVIWKTDSIYAITGDLATGNYSVKQISGTIGTKSPRTICESPNGLFFLDSTKKPRYINSTDFDTSDLRNSTDISFKYRDKFDLISSDMLENCHAVYWEDSVVSQYRIFVPVENTAVQPYPNHCYVYDYTLSLRNGGMSAWFDFDYGINIVSSSIVTKTGDSEKTIYVGDDYGLIWELEKFGQYFDGNEYFRSETDGVVTLGVNTVQCSTATLDVNAFKGMMLILYDEYTYDEIYRSKILSNTADTFTLSDNLTSFPTTNPAVNVGGYLTYFATAPYARDRAGRNRAFKCSMLFDIGFTESDVQAFFQYDFNKLINFTYAYINDPLLLSRTPQSDTYTLTVGASASSYDTAVYDSAMYGEALYGSVEFLLKGDYKFNHVSWGVITREPSKPFGYLGASVFYQYKGLMT